MLVLNLNTCNAHVYSNYLKRVIRVTRKGKLVLELNDGRKAISDGKFNNLDQAEKLILG